MLTIRSGFIFLLSVSSVFTGQELDHHLQRVKIVPGLIPQSPRHPCHVTYEAIGRMKLGERLDPEITNTKPNITWKAQNNTLYTLYLAGCSWDGSKPIPTWTPTKYPWVQCPGAVFDWRQWVVVNIPKNKVRLGDVVFEYMPPGEPRSRKGIEHFTFIIYEQKDRIDVGSMRQKRRHIFPTISNVLDFAIEYEFDVPLAGNHFYTQRVSAAERKSNARTTKKQLLLN